MSIEDRLIEEENISLMKGKRLQRKLGSDKVPIHVEGVTLVLPSRLFMFNKYWRILALS